MEEDIRKRGILYLQQQRFGKKWKKVCATLYRESTCSISRLEFFECKDGTTEKPKNRQENKKIIKMSDCIRVTEAESDGSPKDCRAFLVETTEKIFVFAVEFPELEDWMQKLCEIAFPMNWGERGATRRGSFQSDPDEVSMTDNTLYGGKEAAMKDFKVTMRRTEAADRCGLRGQYLLRTDFDSLLLKELKTGEVIFTWPYRYLRRFGRDKTTFSFEAGRRCDSGEGNFEFETKQGNGIFQHIEAAISLQKASLCQKISSGTRERPQDPVPQPPKVTPPQDDSSATIYSMLCDKQIKERPKQTSPHRSRLETPSDKHLTGVKSLNLDTRPPPRKSQVKNFRSCPLASTEDEAYSQVTAPLPEREVPDRAEQEDRNPSSCPPESDYSLPFDNVAKNIMADILAASHLVPPTVVEPGDEDGWDPDGTEAEPLYDSIDESAVRSPFPHKPRRHSEKYPMEHIYDKPDDCAMTPGPPTALYDDPEEVRGHAWKTHGFMNDPSGHEYPYNSQADDYAVPKPPRRAVIPEQDKKEKKKRKEKVKEEQVMDDSPYDNVRLKI